jgi:hypothetical protein
MFSRCLILVFACLACSMKGITVRSIASGDWQNPNVWSTHQVPVSPDSIIVTHYITLIQDVTLSSPTVLFITAQGTLCGDYLLETLCGANFINYGYMYLNQIKTRLGTNYNVIECKTSIIVTGCLPSTPGFYNLPPNGSIKVWPPVFCKTTDTNWEGGTPTGLTELEKMGLSLYPNPVAGQTLTVLTEGYASYTLTDVTGCVMDSGSFKDQAIIMMHEFPAGMYFLKLERNGKTRVEKILKTDQ